MRCPEEKLQTIRYLTPRTRGRSTEYPPTDHRPPPTDRLAPRSERSHYSPCRLRPVTFLPEPQLRGTAMIHTIRVLLPVMAMLSFGGVGVLTAQVEDPDPLRFAEAIEAFAAFDSHNTVPRNAIVFVGSSSIRFWPTAERFPGLTVINRGFGGSHISDVNHYAK